MVENEELHNENVYAELERDGLMRMLSKEEAAEAFDQQAHRYLSISGDEFLRAWDAGEFDDNPDRPEIMRVAMLIPLVR